MRSLLLKDRDLYKFRWRFIVSAIHYDFYVKPVFSVDMPETSDVSMMCFVGEDNLVTFLQLDFSSIEDSD